MPFFHTDLLLGIVTVVSSFTGFKGQLATRLMTSVKTSPLVMLQRITVGFFPRSEKCGLSLHRFLDLSWYPCNNLITIVFAIGMDYSKSNGTTLSWVVTFLESLFQGKGRGGWEQ